MTLGSDQATPLAVQAQGIIIYGRFTGVHTYIRTSRPYRNKTPYTAVAARLREQTEHAPAESSRGSSRHWPDKKACRTPPETHGKGG